MRGKVEVEVCLISARGLRRTSSLWKLQWFAVGWINPDSKYCTKIDASGNVNPVWKTKFSTTLDDVSEDLALNVEVYSREPFFLRESLLGSATIVLKEFLDKFNSESDVPKPVEEVGSFQLRKKKSNKPLGFVDVSIRVSEDPSSSYLGADEGLNLADNNGGINLAATGYGSLRPHLSLNPSQQQESSQVKPFYSNHPHVGGANYLPPPPPPSNFFPTTGNYVNMPSSAGRGVGMGVGAGALAGVSPPPRPPPPPRPLPPRPPPSAAANLDESETSASCPVSSCTRARNSEAVAWNHRSGALVWSTLVPEVLVQGAYILEQNWWSLTFSVPKSGFLPQIQDAG